MMTLIAIGVAHIITSLAIVAFMGDGPTGAEKGQREALQRLLLERNKANLSRGVAL